MKRPTDLEIATAICCGEICRTETRHCHAGDHFSEAYRVRRLLDRYELGPVELPEAEARPPRGEETSQRSTPHSRRRRRVRK